MCHHTTLLSIRGPRRQVRRCSCGAIHVVWDSLNLSLMPEEWADLCFICLAPDPPEALGLWQTHRTERSVGLWHGPFGATFSRDDWNAFGAMLASVDLSAPPPVVRELYALN